MLLRSLSLLACVWVFGACTAIAGEVEQLAISANLKDLANSGKGIVIFSTTESGERSGATPYLHLKRVYSKPFDGKVLMWNENDKKDLENTKKYRAQAFGRVHVLALPEGHYDFYLYQDEDGDGDDLNSKDSYKHFEINYDVVAGEVRYIGNMGFYFYPTSGVYKLYLVDKFERDVSSFHDRYPQFLNVTIKNEIMAHGEK